jgi:hypothetical protein
MARAYLEKYGKSEKRKTNKTGSKMDGTGAAR